MTKRYPWGGELERWLDSLSEGWQQIREQTTQALIRFNTGTGPNHSIDAQIMRQAPRWGLLATELREDEQQIVIRIEAPGMEADQFDINIVDRYLIVRGEKRMEHEERRGRYHLMERAYGSFERTIPLPSSVDQGHIKASYRNGILKIVLPKHQGENSPRAHVTVTEE